MLLRGPSGSGKSDLALRLIDGGARLVADDQVEVAVDEDRLVARAPATIAGLLEVRGVGILRVPSVAEAVIGLVIDLAATAEAVDRLPETPWCTLFGRRLPGLRLQPFHASTPAKLRLAAGAARDGTFGALPDVIGACPR